jgi:hypothetical protein
MTANAAVSSFHFLGCLADGQIGQVACGGGKGAVNSMVLPMAI